MRRIAHWTPRYVWSRLKLMAWERRNPRAPWITPSMVEALENRLGPGDSGLEWGSGRSTVWLARRTNRLVSIEDDPDWYREVRTQLAEAALENVEYRLCRSDHEYLAVAEGLPAGSLDYVLVDGKLRARCALAAIALIKAGGIVIVDDCHRYLPSSSRSPGSRRLEQGPASDQWAKFAAAVEEWRRVWTTNGVTDSAFWQKPVRRGPQ